MRLKIKAELEIRLYFDIRIMEGQVFSSFEWEELGGESWSNLIMVPDFNKNTIDTLAKRASYKCSNPDCRAVTIGPNSNPKKTVLIGEAAHIFGARQGAKRFNPNMTDDQRVLNLSQDDLGKGRESQIKRPV